MKNYKDLLDDAESALRDVTHKGNLGGDAAKIIGAAAIGLAVGAVAGVLFAPDRGSATRRNIAGNVNDLATNVADKARQGVDAIRSRVGGSGSTGNTSAETSAPL